MKNMTRPKWNNSERKKKPQEARVEASVTVESVVVSERPERKREEGK